MTEAQMAVLLEVVAELQDDVAELQQATGHPRPRELFHIQRRLAAVTPVFSAVEVSDLDKLIEELHGFFVEMDVAHLTQAGNTFNVLMDEGGPTFRITVETISA
jgi:hypothetical protein